VQCANQTVTYREAHFWLLNFGYLRGNSDIRIRMRRLMWMF
jgi:hypothetical protein